MPLPIAPIAGIALRYGAVALVGYAIARNATPAPVDIRAEDALDGVDEGIALRTDDDCVYTTARWRRIVRVGSRGPGFEVDATSISRIKFRRVAALT